MEDLPLEGFVECEVAEAYAFFGEEVVEDIVEILEDHANISYVIVKRALFHYYILWFL